MAIRTRSRRSTISGRSRAIPGPPARTGCSSPPAAPRTERPLLRAFCAAAFLGLVAACEPTPVKEKDFTLSVVGFDQLPGWADDRHAGALMAFLRSCEALLEKPPEAALGTEAVPVTGEDFRAPCTAATAVPPGDELAARRFFESWFRPFAVSGPDGSDGLFTGYFEIELHGTAEAVDGFAVPVYRLPDDHVTVDLGAFDPELKGRRVVGRVEGGRLVPYHTRGAIDQGVLAGRQLEMLWIADPIDVFMLHVQGSGRVVLPDGSVVRVGFAGHNGHRYVSIGRALIERGELRPGQADWPDIRAWIRKNPDKAAELLAVNPRYIFFRFVEGLAPEAGPIGAQGVPLTPERSIAVDRRYIPMGLPMWIDTVWPGEEARPLQRLVVAQDAGAAITGPVRADYFWGFGDPALAYAGRMKSMGRYYILLPRTAAGQFARR